MTDVNFVEAMKPLVQALRTGQDQYPLSSDRDLRAAAAVVEALGIPAQMVANPAFRTDLAALVARHALPPIRPDEPEAVTTPNG